MLEIMLTIFCRKYSRIVSVFESNYTHKSSRCYSDVAIQELEPKKSLQVTPETQHECLAQVITPLWQLPYPEQLKLKRKWCFNVLKTIRNKFNKETKKGKGRIVNCRIHPVKPSPITEAYRNKDEFNIRTGVDGNPKTVGFFIGSPAEGPVVCVRGTHLLNIRDSHKQVAQAYEDYVRSSPLSACHDFRDGGHWRSLVVRSNEEGKVMAIAVFHPQEMEPERVDEEADKLRDYFLHGPGSQCNLESLYFQPCRHTRCTADQAPFKLLLGKPHLIERLGDFKFQISPDSFFQVNTAAASVLYNTALNLADLTPMTTLLDVCSGTGTVSILSSEHVRGAVGVESVYSAVTDARQNALLNKTNNVEFIPGLAEKKIPRIITELGMASDIMAVVNPGRSGIHPHVITSLCNTSQIRRIVYISCKADSPNTMSNFVQLCSEGKFSLERIVPVDMFPHTLHTELVLSFRR